MWPFSKPTIEDLQSKAYLVYTEFGKKAQIPREQRLWQAFPDVDRTTIKIWLDQFRAIDDDLTRFEAKTPDFNDSLLRKYLSERYPFLNKKALDRAAFLCWFANR